MDYFYIGADMCRFESKKPCWIIRQFQKLIDLHWVSEPDPNPIDEAAAREKIKEAEEKYLAAKARKEEEVNERYENRLEDMRNFCEKMGVTVEEYPSLTHAYLEATRIKTMKASALIFTNLP